MGTTENATYPDKEGEGNMSVAWYKNQACSEDLWRTRSQNSKKICEFGGFWSSLSDVSELSAGYLSTVSQSTDLWAFPRDTKEAPVYLFIQCVVVYLLFVVWPVLFCAPLPTLEMLLGFLLGEVRCQILSVSEHNRSLPVRLLLSLLKLPLQPWLFFPLCPPPWE